MSSTTPVKISEPTPTSSVLPVAESVQTHSQTDGPDGVQDLKYDSERDDDEDEDDPELQEPSFDYDSRGKQVLNAAGSKKNSQTKKDGNSKDTKTQGGDKKGKDGKK